MDQRHLLEKQRSQLASQRGLIRPPHQLPGRPPLSPFIASQLSHQSASSISTDRFPAPVFAGRVQQPPLACVGPASPHVLERQQRELKDASIMQAKFAQQRAMLAHQVNPAPSHGVEDRVQYVPALMPNMSPEDSLAQLRRLHQQVLSMPSQEPHLFEVPSPNRPRREVQREVPPDLELLGFASKERMQLMEKHLLNSKKQLNNSEQHERIAFYRDRMQQQSSAQGESSYPVIGNRLTPNRPSVFSRTDLATQSLNYRLYQNSAAESARMIQEIEKHREQEHLTRHDQLAFQQKQLPSPDPRLSSHEVSPRMYPSLRARLHASYIANHDRPKETASSVRWEQNIGMPSHIKHLSEQSLPQIKHVKSLAYVKNVPDEKVTRRIDQRDALMKLMESRIKHELDKEDETCPSSHDVKSHSKRSDPSSAMTKVPSHPPTSLPPPPLAPSALPRTVKLHVKEEPLDSLEEQSSSPQDLSSPSLQQLNSGVEKPLRKRPAPRNSEVPPSTKRSRGSGDIFKSRLSEYTSLPSCSGASTGDGTVSSSILPAGSPSPGSVEQPLDLSLNNAGQKCVHAGRQGNHRELSVPLNKSFNTFPHISQLGKLGSKLESPTISDIISHAVAASLEKPYPTDEVPNCIKQDKETTREPSAQTSSTPAKEERTVADSDQGESSASEEECQQQLIDLLSTQFAGSFRNFLVSLLSECKNDSIVKTLAISKAGEKVPIVMKEELERCNLKISQTIRTLLESGDDKVKHNNIRAEGTSSEARVENDTSPPCQVSTTTDIWQHSPPASPADGDLASRSQKSASKLQMEGRLEDTESSREGKLKKVGDQLDGKHVGDLEERKMPSIMKVESLAQLSEHKLHKTVGNVLVEDHLKDSHRPLCIDHGSVMVEESAAIEDDTNPDNEVAKPTKDVEIEEDAIDFLKFGNEEIDADEKKKNSENKFTLFKDESETMIDSVHMDASPGNTCSDKTVKTESQWSDSTLTSRVKADSERVMGSEVIKESSIGEAAIETTNLDKSLHISSNRDYVTDVTKLEENQDYELNEEESELVIAEGVTTEHELSEGEFSTAGDPVAVMGNKIIVQSKKSPPLILPKQPITFASAMPSKPPPLTMVSTPISIALPHLCQIEKVPSHQLVQIVPSQVTSNIVCTLAPPASSVPLSPTLLSSSSVTMNSQVSQTNQSPTLSSSPSPSLLASTQTSVPLCLPQQSSIPKVVVPMASQSKVMPVGPPTGDATAASTAGTRPSTSHVRPSSQPSEPPLSPFPQSRCWKGNLLIPQSTPQEQSNSKKPFVLAYSVVYHSAHLPCVLRSSVPFVPPKILWKNLFPKVSFTDFSKTLSACLILQRYMTVMEQAALQNNLTANGISSCKLVPLDELDDKFKEVQEKLEMGTSQGNSDCTIADR